MRHSTAVHSVVFQVLSYGTEELCVQQVTTVGICAIMRTWAGYTTPFVLPAAQLSGATDIAEWVRGVGRPAAVVSLPQAIQFCNACGIEKGGRGLRWCGGRYIAYV
jgi:hypothetical protein